MGGYLVNFSIYTLAMIGIIFAALFVVKNFSTKCLNKKQGNLNIEESMNLNPRKTLYIISAQGEKFLIASDTERTTLISKLGEEVKTENKIRIDKSHELNSFDGIKGIDDFTTIIDFNKEKMNKKPVMKELAKKLSTI